MVRQARQPMCDDSPQRRLTQRSKRFCLRAYCSAGGEAAAGCSETLPSRGAPGAAGSPGTSAFVFVCAGTSAAEGSALSIRLRRLRPFGAAALSDSAFAPSKPRPDKARERSREGGTLASRGSPSRDLADAGIVGMPPGGRGASLSPCALRVSPSPDALPRRRRAPVSSKTPVSERASAAVASRWLRFRRPIWGGSASAAGAAPPPRLRAAAPVTANEDR